MNVIARIALVIFLFSLAMPVMAADPEPQLPTTPPASTESQPTPSSGVDEAGIPAEQLDANKTLEGQNPTSPMMNEIRVLMDVSRGEVAELVLLAANTTDREASQAIQMEISTIKQQAELDILAIQARYARSAGNAELALQIEASIAAIISPPAPSAPAETRPAPTNQR